MSKRALALILAIMLTVCGTVNIQAAGTYAPIGNGVYTIRNMYTDYYLTYMNGQITQELRRNDNTQNWRFALNADGCNTISPVNAPNYRVAVISISSATELTVAGVNAETGYASWEARSSNGGIVLTPKGTYDFALVGSAYAGEPSYINVIDYSEETGMALDFCWDIRAAQNQSAPTPTPRPTGPTQTASVPVANYPGGTYTGDVTLIMTSSTRNAIIYYTDDGTDPVNSWTRKRYTVGIVISATVTIRAIAEAPGYANSAVATFIFTIQQAAVHPIQPLPQNPGKYNTVIQLTIGATRYTKNNAAAFFDVAPYIEPRTGRTMVPIRFIAEGLGAHVYWDDYTKTDTITLGNRSLQIVVNRQLPNGMGTAVIVRDRLFVPVRYVSEQLGAKVDWNERTKTVTITSTDWR